MWISPAFAQTAGAAPTGDMFSFLLPLVLMFGVFWFLVFRPQQKKMKAHKEMIANVKRGDQVVLGGGIFGRVAKVEGGNVCFVEIAPNIRVKVAQSTIAEVVAKTEPEKAVEADDKDEAKDVAKPS
jgi:preprotein translocase subunit YajC